MGPYERGCGVTSAEQRGPSVCNASFNREGKDEMTRASIDLQDLRRRLYVKAKAETTWRFWGLYVHVCKLETLRAAYALAQKNDGAPGVDGVTFADIEAQGVEAFLVQITSNSKSNKVAHFLGFPNQRRSDSSSGWSFCRPFFLDCAGCARVFRTRGRGAAATSR